MIPLSRATAEYKNCQLKVIPGKYDFKPYAYGFQKDSPLLPVFNYFLKQFQERGALKKITNSYKIGKQSCPDYSGQSLGFSSCFTAFLVLMIGALTAFAFLTLESVLKVI
jgi:hypothetical protein